LVGHTHTAETWLAPSADTQPAVAMHERDGARHKLHIKPARSVPAVMMADVQLHLMVLDLVDC